MEEQKFKVGDKVIRTKLSLDEYWNNLCHEQNLDPNGIFTVKSISNYSLTLKEIGEVVNDYFRVYNFELAEPKKVQKPIEPHCVLIDDCKNWVGYKDNYKEAVELAKSQNEDVTIYKLVEVAKVSSVRKVKKVKSIKKNQKN